MKLTRSDILKKSIKRPLGKLRLQDLRGPMRQFYDADTVTVHETVGMVKILKDRQGVYSNIDRDQDQCATENDVKHAEMVWLAMQKPRQQS